MFAWSHRSLIVLGSILALASSALAQDVPDPLPPPRAASPNPTPSVPVETPSDRMVPTGPAIAYPTPAVTPFPPIGHGNPFTATPIDPIAVSKRAPKFVDKKTNSWHWHRLQGKLLGYPEEFVPRPLGASVCDNINVMKTNSAAARLALFDYDFMPGSAKLTDRGLIQLSKAASQMAVSPFPLLVERSRQNPGLSEARRYAVLAALAAGPNPVPSDRVIVGVPSLIGLSGIDGYLIGNNLIDRTTHYGPPIPLLSNGVNGATGVTNSSLSSP